jgi:Fe-S oxidoreductase
VRGPHASPNELAPSVVDPEVFWACTTCRWCEHACPLDITYVDKLVDMRRNFVLEKAEFPEEANPAFRGYEVNGNPWQLPAEERGDWAEGMDIPLAAEAGGEFEYLFFVGSPGSYDDHGKKVSQAFARLLQTGRCERSPFSVRRSCPAVTPRGALATNTCSRCWPCRTSRP